MVCLNFSKSLRDLTADELQSSEFSNKNFQTILTKLLTIEKKSSKQTVVKKVYIFLIKVIIAILIIDLIYLFDKNLKFKNRSDQNL